MKRLRPYVLQTAILLLFCFTQCKKDKLHSNIILYNKPLSVIQSYLRGKWKCLYGKGGFIANNIQHFDSFYWTFLNHNKIVQVADGDTVSNTTIQWGWDRGTYTNGDSTFTMKFSGNIYEVNRLVNDTLILNDHADDAVLYYFIRF